MNIDDIRFFSTNPPAYAISNRTRAYLGPCLRSHGEEFINRLGKLRIVAYGINDMSNYIEYNQYPLFLLFNINRVFETKKLTSLQLAEIFTWFRKQDFYIQDYAFGNHVYDFLHMFVFQVPNIHKEDYDHYLDSKYSKMYTDEQRKKFYLSRNNPLYDRIYKTITKHPDIKAELEGWLNEGYIANPITLDDDAELDYKWNESVDLMSREIFNFKERYNNETINKNSVNT